MLILSEAVCSDIRRGFLFDSFISVSNKLYQHMTFAYAQQFSWSEGLKKLNSADVLHLLAPKNIFFQIL